MINDFLITVMLKRAGDIHADVNQKFDGKPYIFHLKRVLDAAMKYGQDIVQFEKYKYIIAFGACYHDTIEDARLTYNDVLKEAKKFFDNEEDAETATEIVYALTNEKGRNRAERANDKYYQGIRETPFATFIKFCDRFANYSYAVENKTSMAKKYKQEMPHFIEILLQPKEYTPMYMVPNSILVDLQHLSNI